MTFDKALSIFGIKRDYTEIQLKKRYRELVKENHPDYHMSSSEEEQTKYNHKLQEINTAYEILKKNLNQKNSSYSSNQRQQEYNEPKYDKKDILKQFEMIKK